MWRYRLALVAIWLLAAAGGGVAWLTHNPESEILVRAADWPLIGPLAGRFRALYAAPEPRAASPRELDPGWESDPGRLPGDLAPPGEPSPPSVAGYRVGSIWVPADTPLRRRPEPGAEVDSRLETYARLPLLDRRGDWYQVVHGSRQGWALLEGYGRPGLPPLGSEPEPVLPLPALPPDPARLAAGLAILGPAGAAGWLGPYRLFTDGSDAELLAFGARVAEQVEEAYAERYGVRPLGTPAEVVLLFSRPGSYRDFQRRFERLEGLPASGHVASGIVALYSGDRTRRQVAATLVHELVHLLNRRALGPALPPWLDEGLADDLASSRLEADGTLRPELLGGEIAVTPHRIERSGGLASARRLESWLAEGGVEPLAELLALDWESFVAPERQGRSYVLSAFWIRFLLDGPDEGLATAFRGYLAAVAAGGPATPEELRRRLAMDWADLDASFQRWAAVL